MQLSAPGSGSNTLASMNGAEVVPLFVVDPAFASAGAPRLAHLHDCLTALDRCDPSEPAPCAAGYCSALTGSEDEGVCLLPCFVQSSSACLFGEQQVGIDFSKTDGSIDLFSRWISPLCCR